jgi:sulfate/thiosulfate-binding protein
LPVGESGSKRVPNIEPCPPNYPLPRGELALKLMSLLIVLGATLAMAGCGSSAYDVELVNVSYDPTRELYQEINEAFVAHHERETGQRVKITQSHGGSGAQARAVIDGLNAEVVTLALAGDIDAISKRGLIPEKWQETLDNNSCPYTSTIVLVVRKGNPLGIKDWSDLIRPGVKVITPNPKTSGGARWNFLAAWGYKRDQGSEADAQEFVRRLYDNVPKLDTGARGATETFLRRKLGDVLIAWENEAILIRKEAPAEELELVYPSVSIRAEPPVALVERNAKERGTLETAQAYLRFLYLDEAQDIIGKHGYRPSSPKYQAKYTASLPRIEKLLELKDTRIAGDWETAQRKYFADGGVFDQIYQPRGGR